MRGRKLQGHGREVHPAPLEEDRRVPAALLGSVEQGEGFLGEVGRRHGVGGSWCSSSRTRQIGGLCG
jgi:hypothetical protein